jgi:hypothetical protein
VNEIADGIWRWTARHPEWHPGVWGAEVGCYALVGAGRTVLIDPLAPEGDPGFWERLDGVVTGDVVSLITIGYHLRSAEAVCARYPGATVWGHRNVGRRMADPTPFRDLAPDSTPEGVRAYAIGKPRRAELPVLVESHRALAFGDAVVGTDSGLRMWCNEPIDERRAVRPRPRHARPAGRRRRGGHARGGRARAALVSPRVARLSRGSRRSGSR